MDADLHTRINHLRQQCDELERKLQEAIQFDEALRQKISVIELGIRILNARQKSMTTSLHFLEQEEHDLTRSLLTIQSVLDERHRYCQDAFHALIRLHERLIIMVSETQDEEALAIAQQRFDAVRIVVERDVK